VIRRKTNRRHMIGDHHGRTAGGTTLLVRAVDAILGTHRIKILSKSQVSMPGAGGLERHGRPAADPGLRAARSMTITSRRRLMLEVSP
jgi:hypothetical protein